MTHTRFSLLLLFIALAVTRSNAVPFTIRQDGQFAPDNSAEPSLSPEVSSSPEPVNVSNEETSDDNSGDLLAGSTEPSDEEGEETAEVSPEGQEQCVDARYLSRYPRDHLVHAEPPMADVLCPPHGSLPCGTADHVMIVQGTTSSYRDYCRNVKCTKTHMEVNSVLSHLWEDEEHAGDVKLTMLDARHPAVLQRALHRMIALCRVLTKALL